jgi:hypothetical protein
MKSDEHVWPIFGSCGDRVGRKITETGEVIGHVGDFQVVMLKKDYARLRVYLVQDPRKKEPGKYNATIFKFSKETGYLTLDFDYGPHIDLHTHCLLTQLVHEYMNNPTQRGEGHHEPEGQEHENKKEKEQ